jgi:hypothetical protein
MNGNGVPRGLLRSCSDCPDLQLARGPIWARSWLSKERETSKKGQTQECAVGVRFEQMHKKLLHQRGASVAIRNGVSLIVAYMFLGGPNKRTHRQIFDGEPIKSANNTSPGGVQRLGICGRTRMRCPPQKGKDRKHESI